ncbi:hypothetical protein [Desulfocicer niacini]
MKQEQNRCSYYISGLTEPMGPENHLWHTPLNGGQNDPENSDTCSFTIGDYFKCATDFLFQNKMAALKKGAAFHLQREMTEEQVSKIAIFLEKHGAFYHPARVEVSLASHHPPLIFALNAAISHQGLDLMDTECGCLAQLVPLPRPESPLPAVFAQTRLSFNGKMVGFFLTHWFVGYQEFHVTDSREDPLPIALWQSDGTQITMAKTHHFELYSNAAQILSSFYNPITFEQIFPWHHAAGDFIAREINGTMDAKLITVRGYSALFDIDKPPEKRNMEDIFQGLLLFLLNLSLRMRIDRIDGTGRYHFLPADTVHATLTGFFRALADKTVNGHSQEALQTKFTQFLLQFDTGDFKHILTLILNAHPQPEMEGKLIQKNLDSHVESLYHTMETMGKNRFFIDKVV